MTKKRILWVGHSPMLVLGMSKVCREILMRLDGWDRICVSPNQQWMDVQEIGPAKDGEYIRCLASNSFRGTMYYINLFKPDVVVVYGPVGWISTWITERTQNTMKVYPHKEIFYITVEGSPLSWDFVQRFKTHNPSLVLTPSKWSQQVLANDGIEAEVLYHGIDHQFYVPKSAVKMKKTKFTVGSIARNDTRKGLDYLVEAFKLLDDIPEENIGLFLSCSAISDHGLGSNLRSRAYQKPRLKKQISSCPMSSVGLFFPEQAMPARYHSFDLHAFVTGGESFGLPVLEAAACKVPQLLSNLDVFKEIIGQNGAYYVRTKHKVPSDYGILTFPDPEDIAKGIRKLYENENLRDNLANRAYENSKHLTWDNIVKAFEEYLK